MHSTPEFHIALGKLREFSHIPRYMHEFEEFFPRFLSNSAKFVRIVLTEMYYTCVLLFSPNRMRQPPLIRTKEEVKLKIELLEVRNIFMS